jgi:hypothetical protein
MNAHSRIRSVALGDRPACSIAAAVLADLRAAFTSVDECVAGLDLQTAGAEPDMRALASARFRMSQARHAKRQLVHKACQLLLAGASGADAQSLHAIERANAEYFSSSIEHVRYWTPQMLRSDWEGFCKQSRRMRSRMKQLAVLEQRVLLPMLAKRRHVEPEAKASPSS